MRLELRRDVVPMIESTPCMMREGRQHLRDLDDHVSHEATLD